LGAKTISVTVEKRLLARTDRLAEKLHVGRAVLVARGLQAVSGKGGLAPWRKTVWYRKERHRPGACPPFPPGMKRLAPDAAVFQVSAVKGDGIPAAADWLVGRVGDRGSCGIPAPQLYYSVTGNTLGERPAGANLSENRTRNRYGQTMAMKTI
jgi:hypothetical protein